MQNPDMRALGAFGAGSLLALVAIAPARAGEAHPMRVEYHAPAACPDEAAFVSRVRARVDVRAAAPAETVPTFGVTLLAEGDRVVARIASVNERSEPTSRVVSGTDCSDVADAAALIVAMSLSPLAGIAPADPTAPAAENHAPERDTSAAETPRPANAARIKLLGSALAETAIGYVPAALFAPGARLQLFRTSEYVGGPSLAVGFAALQPTERTLPEGRATVSFDVGELFACPLSFALGPSVTVLPCARFDFGQVNASGSDIPGARSASRTWSSAGALGQIVFVPVRPLVIDAQASLLVPLTPYTFVFAPYSVIYGAPSVAFSGSLAIGVMFL
jgi:hypothetical protein